MINDDDIKIFRDYLKDALIKHLNAPGEGGDNPD